MNPNEEKVLRANIRSLIRYVKQKKLSEEIELRKIIRSLLAQESKTLLEGSTPDNDPTPNKSTGINVLEDLLKKIVPVLEDDYKLITTSEEQRNSFRAHIIQAIVSTLTPVEVNNAAGDGEKPSLEEEIEIDIGDSDEDKFIDIRPDSEKEAEKEPEDPRVEFGKGLEGQDETGRNMAYNTFKKIQSNIIDAYELLSNEEDQELFYDYLIANVKLYFDKFEKELSATVSEPTNQAYDTAARETADLAEPTPDEVELGL